MIARYKNQYPGQYRFIFNNVYVKLLIGNLMIVKN